MKVGDKVILTAQSLEDMGYGSNFEGTIIDILENQPYPYIVNFPEMGKDHKEFFDTGELIKIDE